MVEIRINIDTSKVNLDGVGKKIVDAANKGIQQLTQQTYEEWQNIAARRLNTTRRRYQDALSFTMKGKNAGEITLQAQDPNTNWLVVALETGVESFNIRQAIMKKKSEYKKRWPRPMSDKQRRAMFRYLKEKGRLGKPPVPFADVPFRTKGAKQQGKPNAYRRISPNQDTQSKWDHPGFKDKGTGGPGPLRPEVIEYVKKTAQDVFKPLLARVLV